METYKKRQKELRRLERQRDKFAKRMERKLHRAADAGSEESPDALSAEQSAGTPAVEDQPSQ